MNQKELVSGLGLTGVVIALVAQPVQADTVKVTAVEIKPTAAGIEVVLKTTENKLLQVFTSSYRKTFVANVINTQLQLLNANTFRQVNPTEGIATVTVNSLGANNIRIVVTDKTQLPKGLVRQSEYAERTLCDRTLILSLAAPANTTATQPTSTPDSTTEGEPAAEEPAAER